MKNRTKEWTVTGILHTTNFAMIKAWMAYRHKMEAIGAHKKENLDYFYFRLNAATNLIYGVKQSRSGISSISSSDKSIEDNEPPAKRRILVCMPHNSVRKKDVRYVYARNDVR
ncbi:uncharacterized protein NPIL_453551 [Nephila pilipes]|uniref:Uncharacterized protein n=1 Tax=Nephila pilipes TaxID=299642 RepID=A0A8X6NBW8_NEPPI|nr:uncharacterized protein NPIL_453551 [Nephila pilipes]